MAELPHGCWLIQMNGSRINIFNRNTQEEILDVDASDINAVAIAQKKIYDLKQLDDEQKCFAHFWCGYFYAHATINRWE